MGVTFASPLVPGQSPPNLLSLVNSYSFFKTQLKSPHKSSPSTPLDSLLLPPQGRMCLCVALLPPAWGLQHHPHRAGSPRSLLSWAGQKEVAKSTTAERLRLPTDPEKALDKCQCSNHNAAAQQARERSSFHPIL